MVQQRDLWLCALAYIWAGYLVALRGVAHRTALAGYLSCIQAVPLVSRPQRGFIYLLKETS